MFIAYKSKVDQHITKALEIKKKVEEEERKQAEEEGLYKFSKVGFSFR